MVSGFHPIPGDDSDDEDDGNPAAANGPGDDRQAVRALVSDLERADASPRPWGVLASAVLAFISFGTLPALLWHDRFRDFVDAERRRLRRLAEWMRLHSTRPETMDLRVAGDDLGTRPLLAVLSVLSVVGVAILFATQLTAWPDRPLADSVLAHTYRFKNVYSWEPPLTKGQQLFGAWGIGLSVAYLFHWLQVQAHASDIRRFVRYANRIFRGAGVQRVPLPRVGLGVSFFWMLAGLMLASKGAWWGLALALSGAAQQRYMGGQSIRLRRALAARVREMSRLPAGVGDDRRTARGGRRCPHVRCLAPLPAGARFCPRCGHNVRPLEDSDAERLGRAVVDT